MVFNYYHRLSRPRQAIYRASDRVQKVPISSPAQYQPVLQKLQTCLTQGDKKNLQLYADQFINRLAAQFAAPPLKVRVLATRPSDTESELHGLYEPLEDDRKARITVWMRTAQHKRVVAYKTFCRTLLHELCHHLDYEVLKLAESFHTEGFFMRESSMFKQLHEQADDDN
ncbi:MAG: hypothetical protein ACR2P9_03455 [Gammaproteobacteria bacterium]